MRQVFNPYLPFREYVPDGEPHIFNDRLYVFGSHDKFDGKTYCELSYVLYSCPLSDLGNFVYHGVIYDGKSDPLNDTGKRKMFAPDVAYKNGYYYLYYGLDTSDTIGVARASNPEGPYEFYGHVKHKDGEIWGKKAGDKQQFDPAIFIDEDGTNYLYSGFSSTPEVIERIKAKLPENIKDSLSLKCDGNRVAILEDDMLTIKEVKENLLPGVENSFGTGFEGHEFYEASSMRKFNGMYYAIYSSVNGHELCYAISKYPDRDFKYGGVLHSNGNIGIDEKPSYYYGNNHGSLIEINGDYYVFGHRHTNYSQYSRQGVVERIEMDEKGYFKQAEMTSLGLNNGPLKTNQVFSSVIACVLMSKDGAFQASTKLDKDSNPAITQDDNSNYIDNIQDETLVGYKYFKFDKNKKLSLSLISSDNGYFEIFQDINKDPINVIEVNYCDKITTFENAVNFQDGIYPLYIKFKGNGKVRFFDFEIK